ncbi:hypothetical protein O9993_04870 [Vibrio lentus]|nr:hypothetical protein [Vibrio lentus]
MLFQDTQQLCSCLVVSFPFERERRGKRNDRVSTAPFVPSFHPEVTDSISAAGYSWLKCFPFVDSVLVVCGAIIRNSFIFVFVGMPGSPKTALWVCFSTVLIDAFDLGLSLSFEKKAPPDKLPCDSF